MVRVLSLGFNKDVTGIYNVGLGRENSVNDLARHLVEIIRSGSLIVHADPRKGDIYRSRADITRIKEDLSFVKEVGLREGLKRTFEWYIEENI